MSVCSSAITRWLMAFRLLPASSAQSGGTYCAGLNFIKSSHFSLSRYFGLPLNFSSFPTSPLYPFSHQPRSSSCSAVSPYFLLSFCFQVSFSSSAHSYSLIFALLSLIPLFFTFSSLIFFPSSLLHSFHPPHTFYCSLFLCCFIASLPHLFLFWDIVTWGTEILLCSCSLNFSPFFTACGQLVAPSTASCSSRHHPESSLASALRGTGQSRACDWQVLVSMSVFWVTSPRGPVSTCRSIRS